jgi:hypothetical protein
MGDESWADWHTYLDQAATAYPLAAPALKLLREAQPKWEGKVGLTKSMLDYLILYRLGEPFPWGSEVRVSYADGALEFQLIRNARRAPVVITADRATPENAYAVLDAFLMQLTGTTEAAPSS